MRRLLLATIVWLAAAGSATAADQIYFSAVHNIRSVLVQKINAETERIDMAIWHLTENSITIALLNKWNNGNGVPIRLIGDRAELFELNEVSKREFYKLAAAGIPIRIRTNPSWYPEIMHWKATIFVGQRLVAFGSANYTPSELNPDSSTNYKDETVLLSDDPAIVNAIKTKFDRMWNDTVREPESIVSGPYMKDWDEACATDHTGNCADYHTLHPNRLPMIVDKARLEGDHPLPADLVWGQGPGFNNRLIHEINQETSLVQLVVYRLTVESIANALINRRNAGVPVQVIVEPIEYFNRAWPEFWLTHAYVDKLWAAGVPIKWRTHAGITHMKTLVTSTYATNASSNYAAAWQRDINYFIPRATKPAIHQAIKDRVTAMWNDTQGFAPFQPQPPDRAPLAAPLGGATGVSTTPTFVWNRAAFATSYDVYVGTSSSSLSRVANVAARLVNDPPATYSWTPPVPLQGGTTYFWRVVSRTFATGVNAAIAAESETRSFTTAGGTTTPDPGGSVPSPWTAQDVGGVGLSGSATYASGTFTVNGAGADIWGSSDSFHFVHQGVSGDTQIVARVTSLQNTHPYAKAGIMLRASTAANAPHVILDLVPGGAVEFMTRTSAGGSTTWLSGASQPPPTWLRLVRNGSTVTGSVSSNGTSWTTVGSTTVAMSTSARMGLAVTSHNTSVRTTARFDNVSVSGAGGSPPPSTSSAPDIVVYASDIPSTALRGAWSRVGDSTSPGGVKLQSADNGVASLNNALASPAHYFDVSFTAVANTPYRLWLRLKAAGDSKWNDSVWVQFANARIGGSAAYPINTSSGLLVNLATDATASSLRGWGWQNGAYWLSQGTAVTFPTSGTQTMRIQIREDGVQLDQIVLSPGTHFNGPPGPAGGDSTIVPKP